MGGHCSCTGWTEEGVVVVARVAVAVVWVLDKKVPPSRQRRRAVVTPREGRRSRG
jgi:hypothetical protein